MDADDLNSASANGKVHENGTGEEIPLSASTNGRAGMNGILEIAATSISSAEEAPDGSIADAESKISTISKEPRAKVTDVSKGVKQLKGLSKAKNEKSFEVGNTGTMVKRSKEAKDTQSNGSLVSNSRSKQPSAPKTQNRLSIGREVADNHARAKPIVDGAAASKEHPEINDPPAPTVNMTDSDGLSEKKQLKPVRKVVVNKTDENVQSTLSPTEEDSKHRKQGTLPSYNFSFKCDERAAKRKEFYSKLEEKIQAKEEEKNNIQAKTKETQDAEIKKLRKKLAFKATPMPNFYQEPPPPTPELKKIPTTRAKSPKLGRKKSSPSREEEESEGKDLNISISHRPAAGRLSLDEKSTRTVKVVVGGGGGASSVQPKKPQRKSLPKLPSQKTVLSNYQKSGTFPSSETTRIKAIPSEERDDDESQESTQRTEDHSDEEEDVQEEEDDRAHIVFAPKPIALES